jgi:hypothetical protein
MAKQVTNNIVPNVGMTATHKVFAEGVVVSEGPDICVIESIGALYNIRRETNWDGWIFKVRAPELGDRFQNHEYAYAQYTVIASGDNTVVVRYDHDSSELIELTFVNNERWVDHKNTTWILC